MAKPIEETAARSILAAAEKAGTTLSHLVDLAQKEIPDASLRKEVISGIGNVMWSLYEDVMRPIIRVYPELDPDKEFLPRR